MQIHEKRLTRRKLVKLFLRTAALLGLGGAALKLVARNDFNNGPVSFNICKSCSFNRSTCVPKTSTCRKPKISDAE